MSYADDTCDVCGKLGATVTIYWSDGYMLHAHAECGPEKEHSACTETAPRDIEQWLFSE